MTLMSPLRKKCRSTKKICKDCKYFIPEILENNCRKFGEPDLVTGVIYYESAINVRNNKEKCGNDAFFFEQNKYTPMNI